VNRTLLGNILFVLVVCALCTGCSLIIGKLPPADPIWSAVVPQNAATNGLFGSITQTRLPDGRTGFVTENANTIQKRATENARSYLTQSLPMSPSDFMRFMKDNGFVCDRHGEPECHYTKARPPAECTPSLRVSVEVYYRVGSDGTVNDKSLDIAAMIVEDEAAADERGCFPL